MKLTRVFAGVAAVAVAACSMAITSFAAITNANTEEGTYMCDATAELPSGVALSDVYGAKFTFTGFDEAQGAGGGIIFNSDAGWDQVEWGNDSSGKALTFTADKLEITRLESEPVFADGAQWAQLVVAQWWGVDMTVDSVVFLDKDGNAIGAAEDTPADDTPAEDDTATTTTTAAADDTATTTTTTAASNSAATGVEGVASVVALLTIAGAAIVVTKKN